MFRLLKRSASINIGNQEIEKKTFLIIGFVSKCTAETYLNPSFSYSDVRTKGSSSHLTCCE